jgi:signal peptidase I
MNVMETLSAVKSTGSISHRYLNLVTTGIAIIIGLIILLLLFFKFVPGYGFYVVQSGSMVPAVGVGNLVFTGPPGAVQIGQIVTFQVDGEIVTHRVVSIEGDQIVTQGDANKSPDPRPISAADIRGTYLFQFPGIGYLTDFATTKKGWFILVIIPSIILVLLLVKEILKEAFKKDPASARVAAGLAAGQPVSDTETKPGPLVLLEISKPESEITSPAFPAVCAATAGTGKLDESPVVFSNIETTDLVKSQLKNILADYQ